MQRLFTFVLLVVAVALSGCFRDLPLPAVAGEKRIVLLGEMVAGDTLELRGGLSLPVSQGSVLRPEFPTGLSISITSPTEPPLLLQAGPPDDLNLKTVPFSAPQPVGAGAVYSIYANNPGLKPAVATVEIPKIFFAYIVDTTEVRYGGTRTLQVTIRIYDRGAEKNYYAFEAVREPISLSGRFEWEGSSYTLPYDTVFYDSLRQAGHSLHVDYDTVFVKGLTQRLNTYTNDEATENVKLGSAVAPVRRVLLTDEGFDGGTHDLRVYVDKSYFTQEDIFLKGRVLFTVKSVSEDYFKYLRAYEKFIPVTGLGTIAQPVRIDGNITDGYGVIGGVYRVPFSYVFDRWPY